MYKPTVFLLHFSLSEVYEYTVFSQYCTPQTYVSNLPPPCGWDLRGGGGGTKIRIRRERRNEILPFLPVAASTLLSPYFFRRTRLSAFVNSDLFFGRQRTTWIVPNSHVTQNYCVRMKQEANFVGEVKSSPLFPWDKKPLLAMYHRTQNNPTVQAGSDLFYSSTNSAHLEQNSWQTNVLSQEFPLYL